MSNRKKLMATAAMSGMLFSMSLMTTQQAAHAGTGGSNYNGLAFGGPSQYCDTSLDSVLKTDSQSGQPLANATFSFVPTKFIGGVFFAPTDINGFYAPNMDAAMKFYTIEQINSGIPQQDKALWEYTFNKYIDTAYSASTLGQLYKAGEMQYTAGVNQTGSSTQTGVFVDGTQYTPSEIITFPSDITGLTDPSSQKAAMQSWASMPAAADGSTVTVSQFFTQLKNRLDAEGKALGAYYYWGDTSSVLGNVYDPANPINPATTDPNSYPFNTIFSMGTIGGDPQAQAAVSEYTKAYNEYQDLLNTLKAAGYTNPTADASNNLVLGPFDSTTQNWSNFVQGYNYLVGKIDSNGNALAAGGSNYPFGFLPPSYAIVAMQLTSIDQANVATVGFLTLANQAADQAVNGVSLTDGTTPDQITAVTDTQGKIYFQTFGRSTMSSPNPNSCDHLSVSSAEITAPAGYRIDSTDPQTTTPTNLQPFTSGVTAVNTPLVYTDTLETVAVPNNGAPVNPQFDSGK